MRRLEEYRDEIFSGITIKRARAMEREIDTFCEENRATQEQIDEVFAKSGAGEVLYMLVTAPIEKKEVR